MLGPDDSQNKTTYFLLEQHFSAPDPKDLAGHALAQLRFSETIEEYSVCDSDRHSNVNVVRGKFNILKCLEGAFHYSRSAVRI